MAFLGGCSREEAMKAPPGGIYRSTSAGAGFDQSVNTVKSEDQYIASYDLGKIHRSIQDPNIIFLAAGEKGMVLSRDDGVTWNVIPIPQLAATIDVAQLPTGIFIATGVDSTKQGVAVRSLDTGKSWQVVFTIPVPEEKKGIQILKGPTPAPATVVALELDAKHTDRLWAATNDGTIFVAQQSGKVWQKITEVASPTAAITGDRAGASVVRLLASPVNSNEVLMVTKDKRLLKLKDGKVSEIKVPDSTAIPSSFGLSVNSEKIINAMFVPGFPDALLIATTQGVVVSRDMGKSFLALNLPIDASKSFSEMALAVSPKNANRIFVAIDGVVYRSEDSGTTWNTTDLSSSSVRITDLSIHPLNPATMVLVAKQIES